MEATVASNVVMVVDKTLVIAISGTWTVSVRLLRALATSWRAATNGCLDIVRQLNLSVRRFWRD